MLTIHLSPDPEHQLTQLATQHNLPLETLILQFLQQIVPPDRDDTPKAEVLDGLYCALADVKAGRISPVDTLWDDDGNDRISIPLKFSLPMPSNGKPASSKNAIATLNLTCKPDRATAKWRPDRRSHLWLC